ncbi:MAG: hypothetical protein IPJ19_14875 [Planctomycetes bacterium]|nr:hypothetical protein [Planctomycetota bacterium]
MRKSLIFAVGLAGLVASVFALRGSGSAVEKRTDYYANGQVQSEYVLHEGVRDGACHRYWPDGKPLAEGEFQHGEMSGEWSFWNQDGALDASRSGRYVAGKFLGG